MASPEPMYANDAPYVEAQNRGRFPRGASLPPMLCDEMTKPPLAPPRSRRGSTLSLNKSSQSVHMLGLADRLEHFQTKLDAMKSDLSSQGLLSTPSRPPRRSDRFKKKDFSGFSTLPRNFKTNELDKISEDPSSPKIPMPGQTKLMLPKIPLPGTPSPPMSSQPSVTPSFPRSPQITEIIITPKDHQSSNISGKPLTDTMITSKESPEKGNVPILVASPDGSAKVSNATERVVVTPRLHDKVDNKDPDYSDIDSDLHIYEDVEIPTTIEEVVTKATLNINVSNETPEAGITLNCQNETTTALDWKLRKDSSSGTEYEEVEQNEVEPNIINEEQKEDANEPPVPDDVTENDEGKEEEDSISVTRNDILEGIKQLDSTIENLKIGMIKVYEDVYAKPSKVKTEMLEQTKAIEVETIGPEPEVTLDQQINKDFRRSFLCIKDDLVQPEPSEGQDDDYVDWNTLLSEEATCMTVIEDKLKYVLDQILDFVMMRYKLLFSDPSSWMSCQACTNVSIRVHPT